jgi:hypothetical protein
VKLETDGKKYYNLGHAEHTMLNPMLDGPKTLAGGPR